MLLSRSHRLCYISDILIAPSFSDWFALLSRYRNPTKPLALLHDVGLVGTAIHKSGLIKPLIRAVQVEFETHGAGAGNDGHEHHQDERQSIPGLLRVKEEVRGDKVTDLAEHIHEGDGDGALLGRPAHGAGRPDADERVGEVHAADIDERGGVPGVGVFRCQADDVSDAAKGNRTGEMIPALLLTVRVPGVYQGADGGEDVRRRCQEERHCIAISEAAYDGWEEVGEAVCRRDTNVHADEEPHLVVKDTHLETLPNAGLSLRGGHSISKDAGGGDAAHILRHGPAGTSRGRVRVIREEEKGDEGEAGTCGCEDDEEPLPACEAALALESCVNGGSDKSSDAKRKGLAGIENSAAEGHFLASVPARHDVNGL